MVASQVFNPVFPQIFPPLPMHEYVVWSERRPQPHHMLRSLWMKHVVLCIHLVYKVKTVKTNNIMLRITFPS